MEKRQCKGCGRLVAAYRIGIDGYCPICKDDMKQGSGYGGGENE